MKVDEDAEVMTTRVLSLDGPLVWEISVHLLISPKQQSRLPATSAGPSGSLCDSHVTAHKQRKSASGKDAAD